MKERDDVNSFLRGTAVTDGARYHEDLAIHWSDAYQSGGFLRRLNFIRRLLSRRVGPDQTWLDAGCGSGVLTFELGKLGARGVAVDGSPKMIEEARSQFSERVPSFEFRLVGTIENLGCTDQGFDGVLCSSVLEYLDSPGQALAEFARLLKPGGVLIASVANRRSAIRTVQAFVRFVAKRVGIEVFEYLAVSRNAFTRAEIAASMQDYDFDIVSIDGFDPVLPEWLCWAFPPSLLFIVARRRDQLLRNTQS